MDMRAGTNRWDMPSDEGAKGENDEKPPGKKRRRVDPTGIIPKGNVMVWFRYLSARVGGYIEFVGRQIWEPTFRLNCDKFADVTLRDVHLLVYGIITNQGSFLPIRLCTAAILYIRIWKSLVSMRRVDEHLSIKATTEKLDALIGRVWQPPVVDNLIDRSISLESPGILYALTMDLGHALEILFSKSVLSSRSEYVYAEDLNMPCEPGKKPYFERHSDRHYRKKLRDLARNKDLRKIRHLDAFFNFLMAQEAKLGIVKM